MSGKYRWLALFGNVYGQYSSRIVGHILFHSVPYLEKGNNGSLEYWEYDKLGQAASAGCIRLTVSDAIWIYNNCGNGTMVEFYSSADPGPLGKPGARKISNEAESVRGWDPTDPAANNPWRTYNGNPQTNNIQEEIPVPDNNVTDNNSPVKEEVIDNGGNNEEEKDKDVTDRNGEKEEEVIDNSGNKEEEKGNDVTNSNDDKEEKDDDVTEDNDVEEKEETTIKDNTKNISGGNLNGSKIH